jgi:hypothetical protein
MAVAMPTDLQAGLHALLNSQYCVPSEHWSWESDPRLERAAILKNINISGDLDISLLRGLQATSDHSHHPYKNQCQSTRPFICFDSAPREPGGWHSFIRLIATLTLRSSTFGPIWMTASGCIAGPI